MLLVRMDVKIIHNYLFACLLHQYQGVIIELRSNQTVVVATLLGFDIAKNLPSLGCKDKRKGVFLQCGCFEEVLFAREGSLQTTRILKPSRALDVICSATCKFPCFSYRIKGSSVI